MALNTALNTALQTSKTAYGFWLTYVMLLQFKNKPGYNNTNLLTKILTLNRLPGAGVAKTILRSTAQHANRFSWVLVDAEHGLISDKDYYEVDSFANPPCEGVANGYS
jgi:4-hydroxy-2-oxoheptanedioate aldolase